MPATPRRSGRQAEAGTRFAVDAISDNIRAHRVVYRLSQEALAERMRALGFGQWTQATVSEVERYSRAVTVEELLGLALALEVTPIDLMDPEGLGTVGPSDIIVGAAAMNGALAREWVHDRTRIVSEWFDKEASKVARVEKLHPIPRPGRVEEVSQATLDFERRRREQQP